MIASPLPSIDLDLDNVIIKPVQKAICQTSPLSGGRRRRARAAGRRRRQTQTQENFPVWFTVYCLVKHSFRRLISRRSCSMYSPFLKQIYKVSVLISPFFPPASQNRKEEQYVKSFDGIIVNIFFKVCRLLRDNGNFSKKDWEVRNIHLKPNRIDITLSVYCTD